MRLLDSIARCYAPLVLPSGNNPAQAQLAGPSRFAAQIVACPLRFVLGDDLSEASADLAYADGARLVGCAIAAGPAATAAGGKGRSPATPSPLRSPPATP